MPKSKLMLEEKKGTPSTNTIASASTGAIKGTSQVSAKAQAVADKYGTQDSRYDMGNPEFAKTVNSYRDQQKQKTIDNLINYRAKVLNSKADVDGDRFEYAGELNKQIAHLQSGDATYSDFNKARDFLADKFDNRKYDRDYTKATSLLNKSDEEIDSYIADMEARESDLSYGHYTDSLGEEGTIDEIKQVQKNIASARNLKEVRKMFDAWEVNENYSPVDVLTMNKDGKTVSYDWTDYDTQSKEIDDRIAELTKQMNESDDMIEKAKIMDDIVALQDESIIVADKKNYQDKLISQMLLGSYADTDDVNTFEEVTSLLASRDDNTIQRMGKAGYSALVGAVNTSMNVFDVCKDYLSHKLGSDALNFHPEQFDVNDGENFSTQLRNYEKRLSNESLYGASSTQEAIVKVTNSTVNQLARMPLGEFGSLFTMALQTGAEAYRENLEMGYDRNTALTSAVVNGIITYNVEQIGWQGLEKALNSGAMNYSVGQYLYSLLTNPISEGLEEGVEYIADTWADKLVHPDWIDENGQINGERMAQSLVETLNTSLDGEQIWDAMFLGYLGGFALDTIVATPGFIQSRKQFNAYTQVKANIQQMIQSGMLTQDEVEYYTNTLTAYDIALNAYKGRSLTSDSIQLFSDMVAPMTSVEDAKMSLQESMKPSAEMDAMLEVDTVNKMREAVGVMQQAQQNLLDHGVKMTVTEFAKLSPEERIRVMEEGEHIQATGSSYKFLKTLLDYKGANGEFNKKTGELYLNPTSDETVYVTMIHELTHSLEGSKVYSSIRNMLIDEVGGQEAWDNMVESKRAEYYKKLFDRRSRMGDAYKDYETGDEAQNQKAYELAQFELVAEQMSKGRSAEAIINKMAKYNRSAFYRMFDKIRNSITNDAKSKLETMFVNAVRENNLSRQENSQYSLMEDLPELHKDRAIEEFGITNDFAKAGYIMNDGRLLDFSGGQPTRMEDHRSISSVFDEEMENGTAYLTAFLNEGNIRILPETGGIDVSEVNEPTDFQYSKIRQFMNEDRDGWHTLDISGADGSTIASVEYPPRASSQRIINDLKAFYKDGTIPQNNTINTGLFQYNSNEGTPQFSLASTFQAVGMEITKVGESIVAFNNGEEVKEVTMGMVFRSPIGNMLRMSMDKGFISRADVIKQVKMYTSMLNTVLRTQNPDLIWAIAGSIGYQPAPENVKFNESAPTMHSAFTSNSDTQYGTTFDVTTICTKTQQLIDVASRVMVELDRGLTEEEIINIVYDEVNKTKDDTGANQPVPCPVCYVFSRWVGSGKLLDSIAKLQDKYVNASTEELEARYNALSKQIDDMAKERGVKGTKARDIVAEQIKEEYDRLSLLKAQKSMLRQSLTEEQENRLESLEKDMGILDDWAYLERVRLPSKYNKYHKYDPQKDYVPHDILFDLNKGEQFANEYPYTWAYRTTRGPSMGKAITPYTSQVLGQTIYGVAGSPNGLGKRRSEKYANGKLANAFLSAEITAQAKRKQNDAIRKAKAQNLLGGSRAQSTSDFRFEYVFDYILHFMDLQAIGSKGQTYTKVPEAVPMLASVGYEVNCSLMPFGRGVREVTEDTPNAVQLNDGRWVVLNCSTVTGMNIDDALKFSSIYDNVQPIMVGLNDDHIFACMRDDRITFIIPYHASGGTQARYETMMSELGEIIKAEDRQNYEKSQTDTPLPNATEEQVRRRELRKMILTGKIKEASESDMELIRNSKYLSNLYDRFYVKGVDADCYGVKLSSSQASQIFPFEYWDKTTTFDTADENGRRFWEYCNELGMKPRFAQFGGTDGSEHGYWKMLIDRRMYNNDGTYHVQQAINMSNFNTDFLYRGKMEEGLVQPSKQYKKVAEIGGEKVVLADYIGNKVIDRINQGQYSLKSTFNSDGEELTPSQADYFKDTKVLDANGNLQVTYHGSPTKGITEFDSSRAGSNVQADNVGIYFTNDKDFAEDFSYERIPTDSMFFDNRGEKGEIYKAYLNITNPLDFENLTDEDIENLVDNYVNPSWGFEQKDRLVEELKHARDIGNHQLMKQYLDLNAISEDYDGVIANIENDNSKKEYIVFEPEQIKSTDNLNPTDSNDIRYSLQDDDDYGYHYGAKDIDYNHKSETLWRRPGRSTGAFGTGTYFFGEGRLNEPSFTGKRTEHKVDFSDYNLFKPKTNSDAFKLHDFFKSLDDNYRYQGIQTRAEYDEKLNSIINELDNFDIDNTIMTPIQVDEYRNRLLELEDEDDVDGMIEEASLGDGEPNAWNLAYGLQQMQRRYTRGMRRIDNIEEMHEQIPNMARLLGTSAEQLQSIIDNAMETARADSKKPGFVGGKYDSVGTRVMKALGYDGIDVRHLNQLDNSRYGSVVYDLKPETVRYSLAENSETLIPDDILAQWDEDSLAEVDSINRQAYFDRHPNELGTVDINDMMKDIYRNVANRMPIYTKRQQEAFERYDKYDRSLVRSGEMATLDQMEADVRDMIRRDRIKDINKNGFIQEEADAVEEFNQRINEEIDNIVGRPKTVEDAEELDNVARILDAPPQMESETGKQVARRFGDLLVHELIDHGDEVYRVAREAGNMNIYAKYDYAQNVDNIVGRMFNNQRVDLQTGEVIGRGFEEIFAPIRDSGLAREFGTYMYHLLNIDRMTLEERLGTDLHHYETKPVFSELITARMSQDFVDQMEAEHPQFKQWAEAVYEYENAELDMLVRGGRLSQEQVNHMRAMYPHYVPVSRDMSLEPYVNDEQVVSSNRAVKRATGGTANINPLEFAMKKHSRDVYSTILWNDLFNDLADVYGRPGAENEVGTDYGIDDLDRGAVNPAEGYNQATLVAYRDGERFVVPISQELYNSLMPRKFLPDIPFVHGIDEIRRNLITGWNPIFAFTNAMKDFQDAQFNTKFNPMRYNSAYLKAWNEIRTNGRLYQMYMNLGGEHNSYFRNEEGARDKAPWFLRKIIEANEKVETAPRLAEFICSLESGATTAEAMYNASDITTNFKRGGRTAKYLNRNGFMFLNASIQGFDKQMRNITEAKDKEGWKGVAKYMAKLTVLNAIPLAILNGLVWDDDDDYAELSDYIKRSYYIVGKYGDGKFIRIPKGRVASFIQTVMENARTTDERKSMFDNFVSDIVDDLESFVSNVAPNNPIDNNIVAPLIQASTNKAWYGDDIVPTRLQDERPSEQYDDSTDALSRAIGQFSRKVADETGSSLFELSPYKVHYVLDQYTGAVGDIALPILTPRAENRIDNQLLSGFANPLLDKFTTDSTLKNQRVTDFYAMKEELNKLASSSEATEEQILASKFMNSVSGEMSQLYKDKRAIQSDTSMPNSEKFDEARNIQEQIVELAKKGLTGYDQIDIRGENATVGDVEYKKSSGGDWAKTKTRDFSGYYSTYGLDDEKQSQFKSAMEVTSKKDENGKTIRNSEALATRKALEEMGEYENVLKYIEENGLEYKDFDLNKTVVGYDESKFNDKYNAVYETQEASNEPKSTSYAPRRNASQNGSNDSEDDFFSTLLNIINAPVSTSKSGLSANVAQVFREGRQRSKSIRSNRDDLRKAIAKAKRKYNL